MNTYGDRGNVAALTRRAALRGLSCAGTRVELGDEPPAAATSSSWAAARTACSTPPPPTSPGCARWLEAVIADGGVIFAVCAGLQLLGRRYVAADGSELAGLGLLDLETLAARPGEWRLIGNVVAEVAELVAVAGDAPRPAGHVLVGLREPRRSHVPRCGAARSATCACGFGNNGRDGGEGVNAGRLIATYLHGPVLPKNAWLTDHLLALALAHAGGGTLAAPVHPREDAAQREAVLVAERDAARRAQRARSPACAPRSPADVAVSDLVYAPDAPGGAPGDGPAFAARPRRRAAPRDPGVARLLADFRALLGPGPRPQVKGLEVECLYRTRGDDAAPSCARSRASAAISSTSSGPARLAQLVVTMGDVRGKGVEAAARAIAKYLTRALLAVQRWPLPPGEALRDVHNALLAVPHEPHDFVTVCIATIDARTGSVGLATAGHPAPIVLRARGVERPLLLANPAIGVTEDAELHALSTDFVDSRARRRSALLHRRPLRHARRRGPLLRGRPAGSGPRGAARPAGRAAPRGPDRRRRRFAGHPPTDDVALVLISRTDGRSAAALTRRRAPPRAGQERTLVAAQIGR